MMQNANLYLTQLNIGLMENSMHKQLILDYEMPLVQIKEKYDV